MDTSPHSTFPIWVDFNKSMFADPARQKIGVLLTPRGTLNDLAKYGIELREGMVLRVYSDDADEAGERDDLVAQGVVEFNTQVNSWVLWIDSEQIRHVSQVVTDRTHWARAVDWQYVRNAETR